MNNPFENEQANYFVLMNEEDQYSLWPAFLNVPSGWKIVYGEVSRQLCLDYINSNWKDMRPNRIKAVHSIG